MEHENEYGYRTCEGISFGKEFDKEMNKYAIPSVYFCERNPSHYGYVCKNITPVSDRLGVSVSGFSTNLSRPIHEDVISDDIYDSFLKHILIENQYPSSSSSSSSRTNSHQLPLPIKTRKRSKYGIHKETQDESQLDKPRTRKKKKIRKKKK